ncbi:MAG: hypothetical protein AAF602_09140 [Myxococcota bacterium]
MRPLLATLCLLATSACATKIGAHSLPEVRASYNEAVAQSSREQMLLNVVRLRYNHSVQFLEPVSVVTTYSFTRSGGIAVSGNLNGENSFSPIAGSSLSGGLSATETPTITYSPLSGESFVRQLAAPLPRDLVLLLLQGGWPADLILPFTVHRIGTASAPVIAAADDTSRFARIVDGLAALQAQGELVIELEGEQGPRLGLGDSQVAAGLATNLGLPPDARVFTVSGHLVEREPTDVPLLTRSMMDAMFYLSHGVEVDDDDLAARDLGVPLPVTDPLLTIHSGNQAPAEATVAVPFRGRWYWIDETDRSSKSVFGTLSTLFAVMSAPSEVATPLLTLPR